MDDISELLVKIKLTDGGKQIELQWICPYKEDNQYVNTISTANKIELVNGLILPTDVKSGIAESLKNLATPFCDNTNSGS